jgi:hypothetical protein
MSGRADARTSALRQELARHGRPTVLDLSDDGQYARVHDAWADAGRTPERMPRLFRALERTRELHRHHGGPPLVADGAIGPVVTVTGLGFEDDEDGLQAVGSGLSSVPGGTAYTGLTLQLRDVENQQPIGTPAVVDDFADGLYQPIQASGTVRDRDVPILADLNTTMSTDADLVAAGAPPLTLCSQVVETFAYPKTPPRSTAPIQKTHRSVNYVMVCLLRSQGDDQDCDYGPFGTNLVQVPISGSISYFDPILPFTATNARASLYLVSRKSGGGPRYTLPGDALTGFTPSVDRLSLTWNWPAPRFAAADPFATYEYVDLVLSFGVTTTGSPSMIFAYVSSSVGVVNGPATERLLPLQFATGCLATGTPVTLADGTTIPVEDLVAGDRLRHALSGAALTVRSTSNGPEPDPLVWLRADGGHELLLTVGHPVLTAEGVRRADRVTRGDVLCTATGPARVIARERRPYGGLVHSAQVGTAAELAALGVEHGTFLADGIAVGDAGLQAATGAGDAAPAEDVLARLPRAWHEDFLATTDA